MIMAIKKLQNNFTTPYQSKRLLELGVPVDSADCYYDSWKQIQWRQLADLHNDFFDKYKYYIPCWSVGRLMEIYLICKSDYSVGLHFESVYDWDEEIVDSMYDLFYATIKCGNIDFSKLEK